MTKLFKSALIAATVSFAGPALAASDTVLVVDFNRVFADSAAGKSGTSQLQTKFNGVLQQRRAALQSAGQAFQTQRDTAQRTIKPGTPVPPATQQALQQALERAQQAQGQLQDLEQDVNESASYVRQQIIERSQPLAEQIRAERKAAIVVDKGQALASDPSVDVTAVLIQRLDAAFSQPSITPPQQSAPAAPSTTPARGTPQGR